MKNLTTIKALMHDAIQSTLETIFAKDEFRSFGCRCNNPIHVALLPNIVSKMVTFEQCFATTVASIWVELARKICDVVYGKCTRAHRINGQIPAERLRRIYEVVNRIGYPEQHALKIMPNWDNELEYILKGGGELLPTTVIADIYVEKGSTKHAFELKAPLPNSDQTKVSKEKLLKLYSMVEKPISSAFYALPYNPYGKRENYNWSFPARWFDMKADKVVLIGDEFWDFIGGKGTYQLFIDEINKLGTEYKDRIYREYLGIDNHHAKGFELK